MLLRHLSSVDIDDVAALWAASWKASHAHLADPDIDATRTNAWYCAVAASFPGHGLVAQSADAIIGFTTWAGTELERIFVAPAQAGAGVGPALLAATENALREDGVSCSWLHCRVGNTLAYRFFTRQGWSLFDIEHVPLKATTPPRSVQVWRMVKDLRSTPRPLY